MTISPQQKEAVLAVALVGLLLLSILLPAYAQDAHYHQFADSRSWQGIPCAANVLSNVGFLLGGCAGLWQAWFRPQLFFSPELRRSCVVFFIGLVCTAFGSAYYHASPDDVGLAVDRYGMVIAFAGMLGAAAAHKISDRASTLLGGVALVAGLASVAVWQLTSSLSPYAVVQFGGIALLLGVLLSPSRGIGPYWAVIVLAYIGAKLCEMWDAQIYLLTLERVSGHTLKHILAAVPAWATIAGVHRAAAASTVQHAHQP